MHLKGSRVEKHFPGSMAPWGDSSLLLLSKYKRKHKFGPPSLQFILYGH